MKKIIPLALLCISILFVSCKSNDDKTIINKVAYSYLDNMGNYKIERAEKYADSATRVITLQFIERKIIPYLDEEYIKKNTPAKITIGNIDIVDDTSAVVSYHKSTPITEQDGELEMRKEKDEWLAHVLIQVPDIFMLDEDEMRANIRKMDSLNGTEIKIKKFDGPRPR